MSQGHALTSLICRFTKLVYEPEGRDVMNALWEEVMAEYAFAGVHNILERSKAGGL